MDFLFQLIQVFMPLRRIPIRPESNDVILQIVVPVVDQVYRPLRLLVLFVLAVQDRLYCLQLPLDPGRLPLRLIGIKDRDASQVD